MNKNSRPAKNPSDLVSNARLLHTINSQETTLRQINSRDIVDRFASP